MGAWGVKATESDYGQDLLLIVEKRHLRESEYKRFCVSEIMELLNDHILDEIRYANRGCPKEAMDLYIQSEYPYRYEQAIVLVCEMLAEYFERGKIIYEAYETGRQQPTRKEIADIIVTASGRRGQPIVERILKALGHADTDREIYDRRRAGARPRV